MFIFSLSFLCSTYRINFAEEIPNEVYKRAEIVPKSQSNNMIQWKFSQEFQACLSLLCVCACYVI